MLSISKTLVSKSVAALTLFVSLSSIAPGAASADRAFAKAPSQGARMPMPDEDILYVPPVVVSRDTVRAALSVQRAKNLQAFRAYVRGGVYPSNTFQPRMLNVWRDRDGHFCAAATIIRMSGQTALVDKVAEQNNTIRLADVKQGPLMDWILKSGFTQDEIAMIQEPMSPVMRPDVGAPIDAPDVDAKLRAQETARLKLKYAQIDKVLVAGEKANLELAVTRVMKNQQLAAELVEGNAPLED